MNLLQRSSRAGKQEIMQLTVPESSWFQVTEDEGIGWPHWVDGSVLLASLGGLERPPIMWRSVSKCQDPCHQVGFKGQTTAANWEERKLEMTREKPWGSERNKRSQADSIHQGKPGEKRMVSDQDSRLLKAMHIFDSLCPLASREVFYPVAKSALPGWQDSLSAGCITTFPTCCQNVSGRVTVILFHEDVTHGAIAGNSDFPVNACHSGMDV